jgi:uncharacterized protein YggE
MDQPTPSANKLSLNLKLDYRILVAVLLVVIAAMLAVWKPWSAAPSAKDRTVTVTGDATVKSKPDEFLFSPAYEFKNSDKTAALQQVSDKNNEVVTGLKKLGVQDSKIQNNANSWSYPNYNGGDSSSVPTYNLNLTVTVTDEKLVQKVEYYLLTTSPTGQLTPQPTFSTAKEKTLQAQARDLATKDARSKADQSAQNLGFKVGAVKSLDDGIGFGGGIRPMYAEGTSLDSSTKNQSLTVQPGENELSYTVTVVYYIK